MRVIRNKVLVCSSTKFDNIYFDQNWGNELAKKRGGGLELDIIFENGSAFPSPVIFIYDCEQIYKKICVVYWMSETVLF